MFTKILAILISVFPVLSAADESDNTKVYIEKDGQLYEMVDRVQIEGILEFAVVNEINISELEDEEVVAWFTESQEDKPTQK